MLVIQLNNNHLNVLSDPVLSDLYTCVQELLLWKGECPMDSEAGVDYLAIFENQKFVELELKRVLDKHKNAFINYNIESVNYDSDLLKVDIIFNVSQEKSFRFNLHVGNKK